METKPIPTMVTIKRASELTGLSYHCLRRMCLENQIVHIRTGAKFLINLERLADYLNGSDHGANTEAAS